MELKGLHHVTSITSDATKIYNFFTKVLGLRLVKKTINQDDIHTYHLFFADKKGTPGTDITFFDFKGVKKGIHGNNSINRTGFRVKNDKALLYWLKRFDHYKVKHSKIEILFNKKVLYFSDFDGALYMLISDELDKTTNKAIPWDKSSVIDEYAILGLGTTFINTSNLNNMDYILTNVFKMKQTNQQDNLYLYEMGEGGNGASLIINYNQKLDYSYQGYGTIHHIAFSVGKEENLIKWIDYMSSLGIRHSGFIDRFYFYSLYIRISPSILFELATDEPGFVDDEETLEKLGTTLALPPKFRDHRAYILSQIEEIDTSDSIVKFPKEAFDD